MHKFVIAALLGSAVTAQQFSNFLDSESKVLSAGDKFLIAMEREKEKYDKYDKKEDYKKEDYKKEDKKEDYKKEDKKEDYKKKDDKYDDGKYDKKEERHYHHRDPWDEFLHDVERGAEDVGREIEHGFNDVARELEDYIPKDIDHWGDTCPYVKSSMQGNIDWKKYNGDWLLFRQTYDNFELFNTKMGKCSSHDVSFNNLSYTFMTLKTDDIVYNKNEAHPDFYRGEYDKFQMTLVSRNNFRIHRRGHYHDKIMDYQVLDTDYKTYSIVYSCSEPKVYGMIKQSLFIFTREPVDTSKGYKAYNDIMQKARNTLKYQMQEWRANELLRTLGPQQDHPNTDAEYCRSFR